MPELSVERWALDVQRCEAKGTRIILAARGNELRPHFRRNGRRDGVR